MGLQEFELGAQQDGAVVPRARVTGALACLLFLILLGASIAKPETGEVVADLAAASAAVIAGSLAWLAARRGSGQERRGWRWLSLSAGCWAIGQLSWTAVEVFDLTTTAPNPADIGYLVAIPLAIIGISSLLDSPVGALARLRNLLEAIIVAGAALLIGWVVILGPLYDRRSGSGLSDLIPLIYPAGDLIVVALLGVALARPRHGNRKPLGWLVAGFVALTAANTSFASVRIDGGSTAGNVAALGWVVGYLCIGFAALQAQSAVPEVGGAPTPAGRLLAQIPTVILAVTGVFFLVHVRMDPDDATTWWIGTALLLVTCIHLMVSSIEREQVTSHLEEAVRARTTMLAARERFFRSLVRNSSEVVTVLDAHGLIIHQTPAIHRVLGHDPSDVVGRNFVRLVGGGDADRMVAALDEAAATPGRNVVTEMSARHADGTDRRVELAVTSLLDDPAVEGLVVNLRDVTERRALEDQLTHQVFHDSLTTLPNRSLFRDRLHNCLERIHRSTGGAAVLFVDLDGFKSVNDGLGHSYGDALLCAFAQRIRALIRPGDTFARLGGDEFAVLVEDDDAGRAAIVLAERILGALAPPFVLDGRSIIVGASIGIATSDTSPGAEELLRDADVALYQAKSAGKGRLALFAREMHATALNRLDLETSLRRALEHDELFLEYQPMIELNTGVIVAVEALMRWRHPHKGLIPPAEFIPVAEESGLILPMGRKALTLACTQAATWHDELGDTAPTITVNVSGRQLGHPDFVDELARTLMEVGLPSPSLVLELTESLMIEDSAVLNRLDELKELGVRLAIDDFGTGYSSLSYLQNLPIDILKIDRSFVASMADAPEKVALLQSIIDIGHTLRLNLVAEGIETAQEYLTLRDLGCAYGQGYLISHPVSADAVTGFLRAQLDLRRGSAELMADEGSVASPT